MNADADPANVGGAGADQANADADTANTGPADEDPVSADNYMEKIASLPKVQDNRYMIFKAVIETYRNPLNDYTEHSSGKLTSVLGTTREEVSGDKKDNPTVDLEALEEKTKKVEAEVGLLHEILDLQIVNDQNVMAMLNKYGIVKQYYEANFGFPIQEAQRKIAFYINRKNILQSLSVGIREEMAVQALLDTVVDDGMSGSETIVKDYHAAVTEARDLTTGEEAAISKEMESSEGIRTLVKIFMGFESDVTKRLKTVTCTKRTFPFIYIALREIYSSKKEEFQKVEYTDENVDDNAFVSKLLHLTFISRIFICGLKNFNIENMSESQQKAYVDEIKVQFKNDYDFAMIGVSEKRFKLFQKACKKNNTIPELDTLEAIVLSTRYEDRQGLLWYTIKLLQLPQRPLFQFFDTYIIQDSVFRRLKKAAGKILLNGKIQKFSAFVVVSAIMVYGLSGVYSAYNQIEENPTKTPVGEFSQTPKSPVNIELNEEAGTGKEEQQQVLPSSLDNLHKYRFLMGAPDTTEIERPSDQRDSENLISSYEETSTSDARRVFGLGRISSVLAENGDNVGAQITSRPINETTMQMSDTFGYDLTKIAEEISTAIDVFDTSGSNSATVYKTTVIEGSFYDIVSHIVDRSIVLMKPYDRFLITHDLKGELKVVWQTDRDEKIAIDYSQLYLSLEVTREGDLIGETNMEIDVLGRVGTDELGTPTELFALVENSLIPFDEVQKYTETTPLYYSLARLPGSNGVKFTIPQKVVRGNNYVFAGLPESQRLSGTGQGGGPGITGAGSGSTDQTLSQKPTALFPNQSWSDMWKNFQESAGEYVGGTVNLLPSNVSPEIPTAAMNEFINLTNTFKAFASDAIGRGYTNAGDAVRNFIAKDTLVAISTSFGGLLAYILLGTYQSYRDNNGKATADVKKTQQSGVASKRTTTNGWPYDTVEWLYIDEMDTFVEKYRNGQFNDQYLAGRYWATGEADGRVKKYTAYLNDGVVDFGTDEKSRELFNTYDIDMVDGFVLDDETPECQTTPESVYAKHKYELLVNVDAFSVLKQVLKAYDVGIRINHWVIGSVTRVIDDVRIVYANNYLYVVKEAPRIYSLAATDSVPYSSYLRFYTTSGKRRKEPISQSSEEFRTKLASLCLGHDSVLMATADYARRLRDIA